MRNMFFQLTSFLLLLLLFTFFIGCSGGGDVDPIVPAEPERETVGGSHCTWGLWQFVADSANGTIDVMQLRSGNMHLNALPFLEPPPNVLLTLESLEFNGNIIEADIGLRHPFLGLTEFTGFDVCGILITNGSVSGFSDPNLRMAGDGDTRLLNPDGYSRWWNPAEFPVNNGTMFSYNDGLLGAPDSQADYDCTLNGYKYYSNDLGPDDGLDEVDLGNRGMFSAGQKNIRHFTIELGSEGLIFNYAIDACWAFPSGAPPWQAPDDFPPAANRCEAWNVSITEIENTLWNDGAGSGGSLELLLDVYDWNDAETNMVRVESPGNFAMAESGTPVGTGVGYATYEIEIDDATPDEGEIDLLVSVESGISGYGGLLPGETVTAYFTHTSEVSPDQVNLHKNMPLRDDAEAKDIAIDHTDGDLLVLYSDLKIYKYEKDDYFETYSEFATVQPNAAIPRYIDLAPDRYFVVAVVYSNSELAGQIYNPDGDYITQIMHHPDGPMDVAAMTGGGYQNDLCSILGVSGPAYFITDVPRYAHGTWNPAAAYHDYYIYDGDTYGYDRVYYDYVKGVESDSGGNYIWFLEDPDYYASRWELYTVGSKGYLQYNNAYFGTGVQTDNDNGWYDAKDITRDNQNRYFVLDELSSGEPRVKVWTVSGNDTSSIGGFGDSTTISGTPLRIEGSDYDGDIVVLHGDTPPHMISVFSPSEMPGG